MVISSHGHGAIAAEHTMLGTQLLLVLHQLPRILLLLLVV
jgi:hypothetical protein